MNKKIPIAGFFVTIMLMSQLTVLTTPVLADENETVLIRLSTNELRKLDNAIDNIADSDIQDTLNSILDDFINDAGEMDVAGLAEMLIALDNVISEPGGLPSNIVFSIQDLIRAIINIIISHIQDIPEYVIEEMVGVLEGLLNIIVKITSGNYLEVISGLYDLLTDMNDLINYLKDLPTNNEDFKLWMKERIKNAINRALSEALEEIKDVFVNYYLKPHLGYVNRIGTDLYDLVKYSAELVQDFPIFLERYKAIFIDLPNAFEAFRVADKVADKIAKLIAFVGKLIIAIQAAEDWYQDIVDEDGPDVAVDVAVIVASLYDLLSYCNEEPKPWFQPVTITGTISGVKSAEISFIDDNQTNSITAQSSEEFTICYDTSITNNPPSVHSFTLEAKSGEKTKTVQCYLTFSDGDVSVEFNFDSKASSTTPSKTGFFRERFMNILESFSLLLTNIFRGQFLRNLPAFQNLC